MTWKHLYEVMRSVELCHSCCLLFFVLFYSITFLFCVCRKYAGGLFLGRAFHTE